MRGFSLAAGLLSYNYFRDYEPGTGRYVESDPIGLNGGLATYAYVANRPLTFKDPLGLEACGGCDERDPENMALINACVAEKCLRSL